MRIILKYKYMKKQHFHSIFFVYTIFYSYLCILLIIRYTYIAFENETNCHFASALP